MAERSKSLHHTEGVRSRQGSGVRHLPSATEPRNPPAEPIAIADMANLFGVTHRTLHFYEEKGLIAAGRVGLMRVYDHGDVRRMAVINTCREIGMPVAVIQELMEELDGAESQAEADAVFHTALLARKRELTAAFSEIQRQTQRIDRLMAREEDGELRRAPREAIELTDTERRCLELMAEGYTPLRLARALEFTGEEIAALEQQIVRKFNASNRFQAIAKAVLLGVVAS